MREKVVQSLLEGVDHIQLSVSDLEKAVDWYTRYLGFLRDALASVAKISYFSDEGFAWVLKFCVPFGNELGG